MTRSTLSEERTRIFVGNYVANYDEEGMSISRFCKEKKINPSTFKKILKEEYPDFFQRYYSSDRRSKREKDQQEKREFFAELLETMDPKDHTLDSIDYYEITGEVIKTMNPDKFSCTRGCINKTLSQFYKKNSMESVVTQKEALGSRKYGFMVNNAVRYATKEEKIEIINFLKERKIPICDRTILDQYRRNLGLNSDWHYSKEKKKEKVIKKSEKE